jgi:hypothetical protein
MSSFAIFLASLVSLQERKKMPIAHLNHQQLIIIANISIAPISNCIVHSLLKRESALTMKFACFSAGLVALTVSVLTSGASAALPPKAAAKAKEMKEARRLHKDFLNAMNPKGKGELAKQKENEARDKFFEKLVSNSRKLQDGEDASQYYNVNGYYGEEAEWNGWDLNQDFLFDMTEYSFKYAGCAAIKEYDADLAEEGFNAMKTSTYAVFRLCPAENCNQYSMTGCGKNYGEYVVEMSTYLSAMVGYYEDRYADYCNYCAPCGYTMQKEQNQWLDECYYERTRQEWAYEQQSQQSAWQAYYDANNGDMSGYNQGYTYGSGQQGAYGGGQGNTYYDQYGNQVQGQASGYYYNAQGERVYYNINQGQYNGQYQNYPQYEDGYDPYEYAQQNGGYYANEQARENANNYYENYQHNYQEYEEQQRQENNGNGNRKLDENPYYQNYYYQQDGQYNNADYYHQRQQGDYNANGEKTSQIMYGYYSEYNAWGYYDADGKFHKRGYYDEQTGELIKGYYDEELGYFVESDTIDDDYFIQYAMEKGLGYWDANGQFHAYDEADWANQQDECLMEFYDLYNDCDEYICGDYVEYCTDFYDSAEENQRQHLHISDFTECTEYQSANGQIWYIAPHCGDNHYSIKLGIYTDKYCNNPISENISIDQILGYHVDEDDLMYFPKECISCDGAQRVDVYQTEDGTWEAIPFEEFETYAQYQAWWSNYLQNQYSLRQQAAQMDYENIEDDQVQIANEAMLYQNINMYNNGKYWVNAPDVDSNGVVAFCSALYSSAAQCDINMDTYDSDSMFKTDRELEIEQKVCNFIDNIVYGAYNENGEITLESPMFNFRDWRNPEQYRQLKMPVGQAVGLAMSTLLMVCLIATVCLMQRTLSRGSDNMPWKPRRRFMNPDLSRQNSGIGMARSRSGPASAPLI